MPPPLTAHHPRPARTLRGACAAPVGMVWWAQLVQPYLKNEGVLFCPSADSNYWMNCTCWTPQQPRPLGGYGVNCGSGGQNGTAMPNWFGPLGGHGGAAASDASIGKPAETIWAADSGCINIGPWQWFPTQGSTCPSVALRHNEMANFSFCDSHVKAMKASSTTFDMWTTLGD
jgi:prepilin-type processing-associated H-X9-DG protein